LQSISSSCIFVAIDIAKTRNEVLVEFSGKNRRKRFTVLNTRPDHDFLIDNLKAFELPVIVGLEATGNYHRTMAWNLLQAGFDVRLISSVAMARTREALHNSWDKNDPKDAQVILHMLKLGVSQYYHDPIKANINDIQELSKTHEIISRAKTEVWHRLLTHYLPLYFPEAEHFKGNSRTDWFLAFLGQFPTPRSITKLTEEEFIDSAWKIVGRKVSKLSSPRKQVQFYPRD
ncbi:MAG: IS110 family transposase, partial [Caedimonadaceae bacterium]